MAYLSPEHLAQALEMQRKLWSQERIAKALGVHRSTVSRSLSRHNRREFDRLAKRTSAIKAKQISQLEYMAEESLEEWHRSKQDAEQIKTTQGDDESKIETTIKGQTGNPALLREARGALADVRGILGLDAPPPKPADPPDDDDYDIDLSKEEEDQAQPSDGAPA